MIALITGKLIYKAPGTAIIDVGGVGYEVHIPLSSFFELPNEGQPVTLHIHTHVREDALMLFGFLSVREKGLFLALTAVSGVGPKLALSVISGLPFEVFVDAVLRGDARMISTIPGIGAKTAARLVLELKDKVGALGLQTHIASHAVHSTGPSSSGVRDEAVSALVNLGYKKNHAEEAVKKACASLGDDVGIETIIKDTLKTLSR